MTEFELKFEIPPAQLKGVAAAILEGKATRQRLQASYFDTADGALAAHGIALRLRKEGRRWVQTAKGPTADLHERLEHNVILTSQSAGVTPQLDLSRHRGTPVGKMIDKALGFKNDDTYPGLELLYTTDVQRITRQVSCGISVIEVALDMGRIFAEDRAQRVCELEFELKEGKPSDAAALARQWCATHGLWMSTISKSMKGQRLHKQCNFGDEVTATPPKYSRHASGQDMLTAVLQACLSQILPNMSELASGSNHPDHIHQLRVGIRRLRTALRELAALTKNVTKNLTSNVATNVNNDSTHGSIDAIDPKWEAALVQTFRALGTHRDQSHLALVLQPQLLAAGGPHMRLGNAENTPDPGNAVRAPEFQDALLGLVRFVHRETTKAVDRSGALKKAVSRRLQKLHRGALHDGKKFLALDEAQQHSVRKRLKRLRYVMEFVAPLFNARKVNDTTAALKPVQDALGLYNDELMALHAWRALTADDTRAWFGIGWLTAREQPNAKRCLKKIKTYAEIEPFWRG